MGRAKTATSSARQAKVAKSRKAKRGDRNRCNNQIANGDIEDLTTRVPMKARK